MREGWKEVSLKDLGTWTGGGTPSKRKLKFWENGSIPWVSPKDMKSMYIDDTIDKITPEAVDGSSAKMIDGGSILFVTRSGILRRILPVGLNKKPVAVNQDIKALTVESALPEFVYWFAVGNEYEIRRQCAKDGTTVESIDSQKLFDFKIPLPPLPEQRAIVAKLERLLGELDRSVAELEAARAKLGVWRQSVLREAFAGYKDYTSLKQIADITGGVTKGRKLEGKETFEVPYLRVANVQDGYLDLKLVKKIRVLQRDIDKLTLEYGDVLFTEGGDKDKLGRGTVWKNEVPNCLHQNHIFRARVKSEDELNPYFLSYFAQSPIGKDYFFARAKQTTNLASINKTILASLPVPIVSIEEQLRVVSKIDSDFSVADKLEEEIAAGLERARGLRQGVLGRAFQGNL